MRYFNVGGAVASCLILVVAAITSLFYDTSREVLAATMAASVGIVLMAGTRAIFSKDED